MNTALQDDKEAQAYLPINPATEDIFTKIKDGIILWWAYWKQKSKTT